MTPDAGAKRGTTGRAAVLPVLALLCLAGAFGCEAIAASGLDGDADPDGGGGTDPAPVPGDEDPAANMLPVGCDVENATFSSLAPGDPGDLAGPALARFLIVHGLRVDVPMSTRAFLGYYGTGLEAASAEPVEVAAWLRPLSDAPETGPFELQVAVVAADSAPGDRPPLNLTLSFDTSEGMQGSPIQRVKQGCVALAAALDAGDVVSLVGWDPEQGALLEAHLVAGPDDPVLVGHCNGMSAHGVADPGPALEAAYDLALAGAGPGTANRVILASTGDFVLTADHAALISRMAAGEEGAEVRLAAAGLGSDTAPGTFGSRSLAAAAAYGRGAHLFVDDAAEAAAAFGERLPGLLEPAAEDLRIEIELPPTLRVRPEPATGDDGDVGPVWPPTLGRGGRAVLRRTLASCDQGALDPDARFAVAVRYADPAGGTREIGLETTLAELMDAEAPALAKGRAVAAWAEALEDVRGLSGSAARERLDLAREIVLGAIEELGADPDLAEIDELIGQYRELF